MSPQAEIVPGFPIDTVVYAKDQPEYIPLPVHRLENGICVSRWKATWKERLRFLLTGSIYLSVHTFNTPLQPVKLDIECPLDLPFQ